MPPKKQARPSAECQVCHESASKYRCSQCPVRYCSVACYKKHKEGDCLDQRSVKATQTSDSAPTIADETPGEVAVDSTAEETSERPLKALKDISWPPEPDASIFVDPLKKDDPKPLRREELMRIGKTAIIVAGFRVTDMIATSPQLRQVLATPSLPGILRILDSLPTPNARSSCLARLLGVDEVSLSKPGQETILSQRDSPPPLGDLLNALSGQVEDERKAAEDSGWWLGRDQDRIWIGEDEKRLMRLWAGIVVQSIDGDGRGDVWGQGNLSWEV